MISKMKVSGMHCSSCISVIKLGLEELKGISNVSGDAKQGFVQVVFDEKIVNPQDIAKKIEQAGYKVTDFETKKD